MNDPITLVRRPLETGALAALLGLVCASAAAQAPASPGPAPAPSSSTSSTSTSTSAASEPSPYYIGVNQAFTHDSNVFRSPGGPSDNYSSTSLLGGIDQRIGRQRIFGNANISANRYQDQSQLDNTSYGLAAGLDWATIENLSGNLNVGLSQNLAAPAASGIVPSTRRNIAQTQNIGAVARWGGASLLTLEGTLGYSKVDYSAPEYVFSESSQQSASLGLYYRPGGPLRLGVAGRVTRAETPNAVVLANGSFQGNTVRGNHIDFLADYELSGIVSTNARLSYTRQTNSGISNADFSGLTGSLGVAYRPTGKLLFNLYASRDAGFNSTPFSASVIAFMAGPTPVFTRVTGLYQNNQVTNAIGLSAAYSATAKVNANANLRYARGKLSSTLVSQSISQATPDTTDIVKVASLGATYEYARNLAFACNLARETREISGGTGYSYTANSIGCSGQYTWR